MGNLGDFLSQPIIGELVGGLNGSAGGFIAGLRQNLLAANQKWYIRNVTQTYQVTSMMANPIHFDFYFCRARTVIPATVTSTIALLAAGFTDAGSVVTSATPGATPFWSTRFCEYFKIYKKKSVTLKANQSVSMTIKKFHGKKSGKHFGTIHSKVWDAGVLHRPGFGKCIIYVARGQPIIDSGVLTSAGVTFGQSVFTVVNTIKLEVIAGQYSVPNYQTLSGAVTDLAQTITHAQYINPVVGSNQQVARADVAPTGGSTQVAANV